MTCFFADLRVYTSPRHEPIDLSVEVPGQDIHAALAVLMGWKAGLAVHPQFDTAMETGLAASRTRGRTYLTLREAAQQLRQHFN